MLPRLPMGLDMRRLVTPVANRSFRSRHPEAIEVTNSKRKVAFFTGCMINHLYPDTGESVLKLLRRNNVSVLLPASQHCCGAPALANGDEATAIEMAKAVVNSFTDLDVDAVVTACGSCGAMLRTKVPELLRNFPKYFGEKPGSCPQDSRYYRAVGGYRAGWRAQGSGPECHLS